MQVCSVVHYQAYALLRFGTVLLRCHILVSGMLMAVNLAAHDDAALILIFDTLVLRRLYASDT